MTQRQSKDPLERYYTPPSIVHALCDRLEKVGEPVEDDTLILEPCAGDLSIADVLTETHNSTVLTGEFDPERERDVDVFGDALQLDWSHEATQREGRRATTAITNPPFSLAVPLLKHLTQHVERRVILLLRLSFLEPTKARQGVLGCCTDLPEWTLAKVYVTPRQRFRTPEGDLLGTDSVTTAWCVWEKGDCTHDFGVITRDDQAWWEMS